MGNEIMVSSPLVSVVLVNYCNASLTVDCVNSILKSDYPNYKIVVVDNNSPLRDYKVLTEINDERCSIIRNTQNMGFSSGSNIGIKQAIQEGAEYVLLLNNDTIIDPRLISELVSNANSRTITVPKIYYRMNNDILWYAGGDVDYNRIDSVHRGINKPDIGFDNMDSCTFFSGCCVLLPITVFKTVGFLSEDFFLYYEDLDYSIRVTSEGFSIIYCPQAVLWHDVSSSSGVATKLSIYYQTRNRLMISYKYRFTTISRCYVYFWAIMLGVRGIIKKSNDQIRFKAIRDFRKGMVGKTI